MFQNFHYFSRSLRMLDLKIINFLRKQENGTKTNYNRFSKRQQYISKKKLSFDQNYLSDNISLTFCDASPFLLKICDLNPILINNSSFCLLKYIFHNSVH